MIHGPRINCLNRAKPSFPLFTAPGFFSTTNAAIKGFSCFFDTVIGSECIGCMFSVVTNIQTKGEMKDKYIDE